MAGENEDGTIGKRLDDSVIDALPGFVFVYDCGSRDFIRKSKNLIELVEGMGVALGPELLRAEDRARVAEALRSGFEEGELHASAELPGAQGPRRFDIVLRPLRLEGRDCLVGTGRDERADDRERKAYSNLFERDFTPIVLTDLAGRIVRTNAGFRCLAGLGRDEVDGLDLVGLAAPESRADFLLALRRVGDESFLQYSFEAAFAPPGGRVAIVEVRTGRVDRGRLGPLLAFVVNDVTGRVHAERAMAFALAEKESLLMEIRHRVGNNLQILASIMRLTKNRYADDIGFAEAVLSRVEAMALLYQNMIEDRGIANIHLGDFIEDLMDETRGLYGLRERDLSIEARIEDRGAIDGDRVMPAGLLIAEAARVFIEEGNGSGERLRIGLRRRDGLLELEIASRSRRLPDAYRDPGSDESLLLHVFADQLRARLEIVEGPEDDAEGWTGSRFVITLLD